jgi:myo-inositol-1(or 4)-monophosphatase
MTTHFAPSQTRGNFAEFSLADDLELLTQAAREASAIALRYFGQSPEITIKGDTSPVTAADLAIDAFLHDRLRTARPSYGWLSEERLDDGSRHEAHRSFVLDPIDGTRAFIDEGDEWCISIAIIENGRAIAGVLYQPTKDTLYAAAQSLGSFKNGLALNRIDVAADAALKIAAPRAISQQLRQAFAPKEIKFGPYVPSLALRLAYVAEGRLDATLVKALSAFWDVAAADIILSQASCALTLPDGSPIHYGAASAKLPEMAAGTLPLVKTMLPVVRTLSIS